MRILKQFVVILLLSVLAINSYSQGKIDKSKDELSKGGTSGKGSTSGGSSSDNNSTGGVFTELLGKIFVTLTYYSTIGSYEVEDHLHSNITRYPYYNRVSGNYEKPDSNYTSIKYLRFDLEEKILFGEPDIIRNHLKLKIRPFQYFYLQTDYFELSEKLDKNSTSNLSLLNFNFCYDRFRFELINFGWTLGADYVANNVNKWGFNAGVNADIFIYRGFSIYTSMKWGWINENHVNEFEIHSKYHIKRFFVSLGYEHLKIASPSYNFISLGGGVYL